MNRILRGELGIDTKFWIEWENLMVLDFTLLPHRVALFIKLDRDYLDSEHKYEHPILRVKERILKGNFWEVLVFDYNDITKMGEAKYETLKTEMTEVIYS